MRKRAARLFLPLACALLGSLAAFATTIPPDLAARADQLRREVSPQVLAWVGEQARALARGHGPVDVAALQAAARSRFGTKQIASGKSTALSATTYDAVLGNLEDIDVEALVLLIFMEGVKIEQELTKAALDEMKAVNSEKSQLRAATSGGKTTPTPTPAPDRAAELLASARKLVDKTQTARLSRVVPR